MSITTNLNEKFDNMAKIVEENKELATKIALYAGVAAKIISELNNTFNKGKESKIHVDITVD